MQRRSYLLVTELVERIGLVRSELMTQLREKRFRLVLFAEGGIGPPQQVRHITGIPLRVGVEIPRNLQINNGILRPACLE
jgi:hypothetical protein